MKFFRKEINAQRGTADIIILSDNLFEIPAEKVKDVEVFLTIVGGKEVYRSDKF
jgi:predicted amidohydrolase YtcJ